MTQGCKYIIAYLLILCTTVASISQDQTSIEEADSLYAAQNYVAALTLYERLAAADTTALDLAERGLDCASKSGDLIMARRFAEQILQRDSIHRAAMKSLASIYEQQKSTAKAIKYYTQLKDLFPAEAYNHRKLGQLFKSAGLGRLAAGYFETALDLNPRDQYALNGLAELHMLEKHYPRADSILWQGLGMDSMNVNQNLLIATSKFRQRSYDSTAYYMKRIRGSIDYRPHQNRMLGYAYMQLDSLDLAIRYLNAAIMDEGIKEHAHYNLAVAHEKKGDLEYAKHHFHEALKAGISDNVDLYHRNLARLYNKEADLKSAIPHYKDALKYSDDPILLFYLARAADVYYADKNIALRYYKKYANSTDDNDEYKDYARQRARSLVEELHLKK